MALILTSVASFIYANNTLKNRNQVVNEVYWTGTEIMENITRSIRKAAAVNTPASGNSGSSLDLEMADGTKNPTLFNLSGTNLRIKEGSGNTINLNNDKIEISNLSFKNLGADGGVASISIQFDAKYANPGGREEFNYSKTFYDSASLR